jgi:hypothetical protein
MMTLPTVPHILLMAVAARALVVFAVWGVLRLFGVALFGARSGDHLLVSVDRDEPRLARRPTG